MLKVYFFLQAEARGAEREEEGQVWEEGYERGT